MSDVRVTAIVIHTGAVEYLETTISSLYDSTMVDGLEVILVDNASGTPELQVYEDRYPRLRIVKTDGRYGYPKASNVGLFVARGEYILWCNDDIAVDPDAIEKMVQFLDGNSGYGQVGPMLVNPDRTYQACFSRVTLDLTALFIWQLGLSRVLAPWSLLLSWRGYERREGDVAEVNGGCCLIRTSFLRASGGFDERFFFYAEDFDVSRRVWKSGARVRYLPSATVVHFGGQSTTAVSARRLVFQLQFIRSYLAFLRKHDGYWAARAGALLISATSVIRWGLAAAMAKRVSVRESRQGWLLRGRFTRYVIKELLSPRFADASKLPELDNIPWA